MTPRKFRNTKSSARPKITIPLHESREFFEAKIEKNNVPQDFELKSAIRGMGKVDEMLETLNDTVDKLNSDRTLNEHGRAAEHVRYVDKVAPKVFETIEKVTEIVDRRTDEINAKINEPLNEEGNSRDAKEIRQWAAQNFDTPTAVFKWVKQRIDKQDFSSASAVLSKPAYLVNLSEENRQDLLKYYREKRFAGKMKVKQELERIGKAALHKIVILDKVPKFHFERFSA
ncbi:MAG: hypothetical protein U5K69_30035 [Balneolaceae bacterium]|nr:hypothetical protein [Balneolaceae bacterium]